MLCSFFFVRTHQEIVSSFCKWMCQMKSIIHIARTWMTYVKYSHIRFRLIQFTLEVFSRALKMYAFSPLHTFNANILSVILGRYIHIIFWFTHPHNFYRKHIPFNACHLRLKILLTHVFNGWSWDAKGNFTLPFLWSPNIKIYSIFKCLCFRSFFLCWFWSIKLISNGKGICMLKSLLTNMKIWLFHKSTYLLFRTAFF